MTIVSPDIPRPGRPRGVRRPGGQRAPLLALALERDGREPLHRQLYGQLRDHILAGRLPAGARLPASRSLAEELGCSRNTVTGAFDQLLSEGYLEGRVGAGTYVSRELPEGLLTAAPAAPAPGGARPSPARRLSRRGQRLGAAAREPLDPAVGPAFAMANPDTEHFPFDVWGRLLGRVWRRPPPALLRGGDPGGLPSLRAAIAGHLRAVRGLDCGAGQVLVTAGGQQALDLATRVLLDPGDAAWIEEPGYAGLRAALAAAGARAVAVPVDAEGLSVAEGRRLAPEARLAAVAPSHQYPLGVTMSLARRLELLDWAGSQGAWILEDDYDSEYRYAGRPLTALQGLEAARAGERQVIYVGSFSKVLFPSLRIGYLVAPPDLAEDFLRARRALDDHPSSIVQPALAAFIEEGHFAAHVRRMRRLYAGRQAALLAAGARHLGGLLSLAPDPAGMHLVGAFEPALAARLGDVEAAHRAAAAGVSVRPLSAFYAGPARRRGLLLGYAGVPDAAIEPAVLRLRDALAA